MKQIITIGCVIFLVATLGALQFKEEVIVDKIVVSYDNKKQKEIPVKVTLTKYQLEKMLNMVDQEYGYGGPAAPQDSFTFTSIAKGSQHSEEYSISSTHLARKPIK
jgi:hypothetical protein